MNFLVKNYYKVISMEYLSECLTLVPQFYINIYMKECSSWSLNILIDIPYRKEKI